MLQNATSIGFLQTLPLGNNMNSRRPRWVGQFAFNGLMAVKALLAPTALGAHGLLVNRDGKILLARHTYMGGLSLPGGGVARGEPPDKAVLRELREELGTFRSDPPVLMGLYTRRSGWATNVIALYRLTNAEVEFRPNREISEVMFVDPVQPPAETTAGVRRRLAEHLGTAPLSPFW
jgi:ADP-ribose pyrophosphatase YjhB (NUDIX family)